MPCTTTTAALLCCLLGAAAASIPMVGQQRSLQIISEECQWPAETTPLPWNYNAACSGDSITPPDAWATTEPACAGVRQSPIDIVTSTAVDCASPAMEGIEWNGGSCDWSSLHGKFEHGVEFSFEDCGETAPYFTKEGQRYTLAQLHIHSLSEHTIDGMHGNAELHMVHINDANPEDIVVVGMFIMENTAVDHVTSELATWFAAIAEAFAADHSEGDDGGYRRALTYNTDSGSDGGYSGVANPYAALPHDKTFWTYPGSLTTPPCAEIVTWVVMATPLYLSGSQMTGFFEAMASLGTGFLDAEMHNHRAVQPLNGRVVQACTFANI